MRPMREEGVVVSLANRVGDYSERRPLRALLYSWLLLVFLALLTYSIVWTAGNTAAQAGSARFPRPLSFVVLVFSALVVLGLMAEAVLWIMPRAKTPEDVRDLMTEKFPETGRSMNAYREQHQTRMHAGLSADKDTLLSNVDEVMTPYYRQTRLDPVKDTLILVLRIAAIVAAVALSLENLLLLYDARVVPGLTRTTSFLSVVDYSFTNLTLIGNISLPSSVIGVLFSLGVDAIGLILILGVLVFHVQNIYTRQSVLFGAVYRFIFDVG